MGEDELLQAVSHQEGWFSMFLYLESLGKDQVERALVVAYSAHAFQKRGKGREQRRAAAHVNPAHAHEPVRLK